jgi:hypothetical protein
LNFKYLNGIFVIPVTFFRIILITRRNFKFSKIYTCSWQNLCIFMILFLNLFLD